MILTVTKFRRHCEQSEAISHNPVERTPPNRHLRSARCAIRSETIGRTQTTPDATQTADNTSATASTASPAKALVQSIPKSNRKEEPASLKTVA